MAPHRLSDGTLLEHTEPQLRQFIVQGNLETGGRMRPTGSYLATQELDDVMAYLKTL